MTATSPRIGIVVTLRQDLAQTLEFVHYHLRAGIDTVALYFDDPDDPALDVLSGYHGVICIPCTTMHWQEALGGTPEKMAEKIKANFQCGYQLLSARGLDWIACIDADELLYARGGLVDCLAGVERDVKVLHVRPLEAVHSPDDPTGRVFAARYFKTLPASGLRRWPSRFLAREIDGLTRDGFFGHREGKAFVAGNAGIDVFNHHSPRHSRRHLRRKVSREVWLLHFDSLGFDNWREKWHRRIHGSTRAVNLSDHRRGQQDLIAAAFADGTDAALRRLYRRWFCVTSWQARWREWAGLLVRVDLGDGQFAPPTRGVT